MTDEFAEGIENTNTDYPKEKRTEFLKLSDGHTYSIRILEPKATKVFTHFLGGRYTVRCLGDNCPICKKTMELAAKYPETYKREPGYAPRQKRYYVNVLDKTNVKKCPECGTEYLNPNVGICSSCSVALGDPEPSNTVKMLAKGPAVFGQLNDINKAVLDQQREPIGINNYDLSLVVSGRGKETKITVVPQPQNNEPVEGELELFEISKTLIELEPDEMLDVQRGVSLKDIFAARKADSDDELFDEEISKSIQQEVDDAVSKLFSN